MLSAENFTQSANLSIKLKKKRQTVVLLVLLCTCGKNVQSIWISLPCLPSVFGQTGLSSVYPGSDG